MTLRTNLELEPAESPSAEEVAAQIRSGAFVSDSAFDHFLPVELRRVSFLFWTPLSVAHRVAQWLNELGITSVVDLGSGAGKFCVSTALTSQCSFIGIEHRRHLVEASRNLALTFGLQERVKFIQGSVRELTLPPASAYYLFNPFGENIYGVDERLGDDVEHSRERYEREIRCVEAFFAQAPEGTHVITYNGFGGGLSKQYIQVFADENQSYRLSMYRKFIPKQT